MKKKLNLQIRLIGEDCWKAMPHTPILLECLEPLGHYTETVLEFQNRIVMLAYCHIMKCLGGIFGQFVIEVNEDDIGASFLSHLFCNLVYFFDLHHSLNTFYFGKVSAFLLHFLQDFYMISPTKCLGLGVVGCTQLMCSLVVWQCSLKS